MNRNHPFFHPIYLVLVLFLSAILSGQSYLVHHYNENDGLPSSFVKGISQDGQGRMWFATRVGISCYDGIQWKNFGIPEGLPTLTFSHIFVDSRNRVWALAASDMVIRVIYRDATGDKPWEELPLAIPPEPGLITITAFHVMDRGGKDLVAVGTRKKGLFIWEGPAWAHITGDRGLPSQHINGITSLGEKLYVATEAGISIIPGDMTVDNRLERLLDRFPSHAIKGICVEQKDKFPDHTLRQSRIWVFGKSWLGYIESESLETAFFPLEIPVGQKDENTLLLPDYRAGIYVGHMHSLLYLHEKTRTWQSISIPNGLISDGANSLYIDFEKNIWIACDRGISKIVSRRFANFQQIHGLFEDEVTAILEYEPGKFVLGHNTGLTYYDGKKFQKIPLPSKGEPGRPITRVLDMQKDSKGYVWMALAWSGLAEFHPDRGITRFHGSSGLPANIVSVWLDKDDRVYVGTLQGLFRRAGNTFVHYTPPGLEDISIRKLYGDENGLKYIACHYEGLFVREPGGWKNYRIPDKKNANNVYAVKKVSPDRLFIGTMDGLYILENGNYQKFKSGEFQVNRPVYFILEDTRGQPWFGTDNGVIRLAGNRGIRYSVPEGLSGQETNRAAGILDRDGRIWIGTNRGLSIYSEAFDDRESYQPGPKVQLLFLEASGRKYSLEKTLRLSPRENTLAFHFRGTSFQDESALRFRYKLEGFEREWSTEKSLPDRTTRYTNLSPGTYRFHLKAGNNRGIWSSATISSQITILKPIYNRWWFYIALSLILVAVLYSVLRFVAEKRHSRLLEQQVEERTRQLRETQQKLLQSQKMEAIGTLAGGIAHDFNNVLGMISGYTELAVEEYPDAVEMRSNSQKALIAIKRASTLVKQILTFSRKSNPEQKPLVLGDVVVEAMKLVRFSLPSTIEIRQDIRTGPARVKGNETQVHQVLLNLCTNAAHAMKEKGGTIEIILDEVSLDEKEVAKYSGLKAGDYLCLSVADSGHGIPGEAIKRIFEPYFTTKETGEGSGMGLAVIHGIVKSHGGDITVESNPGEGSVFHILLPLLPETG